jgi:hypothetical protein
MFAFSCYAMLGTIEFVAVTANLNTWLFRGRSRAACTAIKESEEWLACHCSATTIDTTRSLL